MFTIRDRVGALHDMLQPFSQHGINLTKIESRPSRKKAWEYIFFVDLEGHQDDDRVRRALEQLNEQCLFLKVLGSYPAAKEKGNE
jgi:chorismate mutase/prephenate dehydratase